MDGSADTGYEETDDIQPEEHAALTAHEEKLQPSYGTFLKKDTPRSLQDLPRSPQNPRKIPPGSPQDPAKIYETKLPSGELS